MSCSFILSERASLHFYRWLKTWRMLNLQKKLFRSRGDRVISGFCGGLAEYLGTDVVLIRLIYAALTVFTGFFPGILFYLVAWFIVPDEY